MMSVEDLRRWQNKIEGHARDYGLDFFQQVFELVDYRQLNEIAAYGGFPVRYPHWSHGMESVSYTHLTLPTTCNLCSSRWSRYH